MNNLEQLTRRTTRHARRLDTLEARESASARDPIWAWTRAIDYLRAWPGIRAIWANFNQNLIVRPSNLMALTPANNSSSYPFAYQDAGRFFPFTRLRSAQTQYYYDSSSANRWTLDTNTWQADPGVLAGCWFKIDSHPGQDQGIMGAWDANSGLRSWRLDIDQSSGDYLRLSLSSTGTTTGTIVSLSSAVPTGRWVLAVARYEPSTSLKLYLFDGDTVSTVEDTTGIEASLFSTGTITGYVGAYRNSSGTYLTLNGDAGIAFMTPNLVSDAIIRKYHAISRHIYGV